MLNEFGFPYGEERAFCEKCQDYYSMEFPYQCPCQKPKNKSKIKPLDAFFAEYDALVRKGKLSENKPCDQKPSIFSDKK